MSVVAATTHEFTDFQSNAAHRHPSPCLLLLEVCCPPSQILHHLLPPRQHQAFLHLLVPRRPFLALHLPRPQLPFGRHHRICPLCRRRLRIRPSIPNSYFGNHIQAVFNDTSIDALLTTPPQFDVGLL
ncbi:hypothetical protein KSP40_PGU003681 [Platanthera guangdongensis]|uniref:Uncharacterized protein n=1 Tax=Platanthera guangdongensis TaxID=2320717 RepID=A0ABR2M4K0_9ASPA